MDNNYMNNASSVEKVGKAINDRIEYEKMLTEYVNQLRDRSNRDMIQKLGERRAFKLEVLQECGIFYIGEMVEMLIPSYLNMVDEFGVISPTNRKPIFHNRFVIPIKNEVGMVQNLVGYSNEANERYIYGTARYYRRRDTLWGLENLELAYDLGYAILTEGITDAIRLRCMGYNNSFAMCGTHKSEHNIKQLNRCRHGVIKIPDRDDAGIRASKHWNFNRSVTLHVNFKYKDIDEMCREQENIEWFNSYMEGCINWIKSGVNNNLGNIKISENVTIL